MRIEYLEMLNQGWRRALKSVEKNEIWDFHALFLNIQKKRIVNLVVYILLAIDY